MEDCKYRLPCGRCDKYDKDCDFPMKCDHEWLYEGQYSGGEHYCCAKCGTRRSLPIAMFKT